MKALAWMGADSHWPKRALLAAGLAAVLAGFIRYRLWTDLPIERFLLSLLLATLAMAAAWPLRRWLQLSHTGASMLVWLLALVGFVGPLPVLAAGLLGAGALSVGLILVPTEIPARVGVATALGLVLIAGVAGWLQQWPIQFAPLWFGVLAGMALLRRVELVGALRTAAFDLAQQVSHAPRWAGFAVMLLGLSTTACWLPTLQFDDLAYHLNLPSQWLAHGRYQPDPAHQVWSLAPWGDDVLQAIAAVLANQHARGPVNALWLRVAAASLWSVCASLGANATERWAGVALFASFPPLVWMAAGMQTELPASAVLLALAAAAVSSAPRPLLRVAVLFAGLAAFKTIHAFAALPLVAYALWRHRQTLHWLPLVQATVIAVLVGGSSYAMAWWHTGNPLLPLFNHVFASPFAPIEAYRDLRWYTGLRLDLLWRMVFETPRFVEAFRGGIGFAPIALAGAWTLSLLHRPSRAFALVTSLVVAMPLLPLQYARYAYPSLALLSVLLVARGEHHFGRRWFAGSIAAVCLLNLAFQSNSGWLHHSAALKRTIRAGGDASAVFPHYVPERLLLAHVPDREDDIVLATDPQRPYVGELGRRGRLLIDHDPTLANARRQAEADASGALWRVLFRRAEARWLLVVPATASPALQRALRDSGASRVSVVADAELWQLPPPATAPGR